MKHWIIKVFTTEGGTNVIKKWLKGLPVGAQVEIEARLRYLETQQLWGRPYSAKRKGAYNDIHEVIIRWNKNQYRPLGFFGPNQKEFTLLVGAQEKDSKLDPISADDIAEKRRKIVLEDSNYAKIYFTELQR